MNKGDLILEYLTTITEKGDCITNLGDNELQISSEGNVPGNYIFDGDSILQNAIKDVIGMYYDLEYKDWEASGKPDNHIFKDLEILKTLL